MKRSLFAQTIGLSLLLLGGCSSGDAGDQDNVLNKIKVCQNRDPDTGSCADNNGDDINNPNAAGYDFGLHHSDWSDLFYKPTGFYPQAGGWRVRGWAVNLDPLALDHHVSADGSVKGLAMGGSFYTVKNMKVARTSLRISFCDATATVCDTMSVDQLNANGAQLVIAVPNPTGRGETYFNWEFKTGELPVEVIKAWGADVTAQLIYVAAKAQVPTSLCKGSGGADERVVFQQGYYWDPDTFAKSVDPLAITITCEEGAIAEGLARGYSPWSTAIVGDGSAAVMGDWQQSFIRMKTADYCGSGDPFTFHGTKYLISAPLEKVRDNDPIGKLEAIWGPDGAFCVNKTAPNDYRRHPELALGCAAAIPDCDAATVDLRSKTNLMNGIP